MQYNTTLSSGPDESYQFGDDYQGWWSTTRHFRYLANLTYKETKGYNTPGFHKMLRESKLLPQTPFEQKSLQINDTNGKYFISTPTHSQSSDDGIPIQYWDQWGQDFNGYFGAGRPLAYPSEYEIGEAVGRYLDSDVLAVEAAAALYSEGFDFLTFIAEMKETVDMIANSAETIVKLWRKARGNNPVERMKAASDAWLEGRYGWAPAIRDVKDINDLILKELENKERTQKFFNKVSSDKVLYETDTSHTIKDIGVLRYTWMRNDVYDLKLRGHASSQIEPYEFLVDPIVTSWELVRFSFVVDWFINVGSVLAAWRAKQHFSDLQTATSYLLTITSKTKCEDVWAADGYEFSIYDDRVAKLVLKKRIPQVLIPVPQLNVNLSLNKAIDATALLYQMAPPSAKWKVIRSMRKLKEMLST
jgi:hypothetical protein